MIEKKFHLSFLLIAFLLRISFDMYKTNLGKKSENERVYKSGSRSCVKIHLILLAQSGKNRIEEKKLNYFFLCFSSLLIHLKCVQL